MNKLFIEKFQNSSHPTWILLGDGGRELCNEVLIPPNFLPEEIEYVDATRESIDKIDRFLLHCPVKTKVLVCEILNVNKALISAFLKRFEDVKPNVKIIILARSLPDVLYNRGIIVQVESRPLKELEESITKSFSEMRHNHEKGWASLESLIEGINSEQAPKTLLHWFDKQLLRLDPAKDRMIAGIAHDAREKLVDFYNASFRGDLSPKNAFRYMLSMIHCAGLNRYCA